MSGPGRAGAVTHAIYLPRTRRSCSSADVRLESGGWRSEAVREPVRAVLRADDVECHRQYYPAPPRGELRQRFARTGGVRSNAIRRCTRADDGVPQLLGLSMLVARILTVAPV